MAKKNVSQGYLKECLTYNPDTGVFTWNARPLSHFKSAHRCNNWNSRWANTEAGHIENHGYLDIRIGERTYRSHRLAFLYMEGYLPENEVDHMDRNRLNNKWDNLREVSKQCNMQNCNLSKVNTSGVTGVAWAKNKNKWVAYIEVSKSRIHIGSFTNFEDAVMARYQEEISNPLWTCSVDSTAYKYLKGRNLI